MTNQRIIYQTKPKFFNPYGILLLILAAVIIIYPIDSLTLKLIITGFFTFPVIFGIIGDNRTNGIIIHENYLQLTRKRWNGKTEARKINFSEIKLLKWNHGGYRQDRALYLTTKNNSNIKVLIPENPFQFGPILKFLHQKGIDIKLVHSDHELRLFIDDKISEFPMQNESTA